MTKPAIRLLAAGEPLAAHSLGRAYRGDGVERVGEVERTIFAAEEAGGGEGLQLLDFAVPFEPLADVDERRDRRVLRPADLGDPRADVRRGHGLRRDVPGVPVVLVPRVEDVPQVGNDVRADQGAPVQDLGDVFQPLGDLHAVEHRVDGGERAEDLLRRDADLERGVPLGIERFGRRHAAGQPEQDERVGGGLGLLDWLGAVDRPRLARGQGRQAAAFMPRRKSRRVQDASAGVSRVHGLRLLTGSVETRGAPTRPRAGRPGPPAVGGEPTSSRAAVRSSAVGRRPSALR